MKWMRFQELLQIVSILCLTHSHTCSGLLRKERLRRSSGSAVADDSSIPTSSATAESIYEKLYKGIINHGMSPTITFSQQLLAFRQSVNSWFSNYIDWFWCTHTCGCSHNGTVLSLTGEQAVDIILLLDSSASMTRSNFEIGRNFLAVNKRPHRFSHFSCTAFLHLYPRFLQKLTNSLPRHKFLDRSVRVGMISYSISEWLVSEFNLSWTGGMYREMVRRAIKRASFQGEHYRKPARNALFASAWLACMCLLIFFFHNA